MSRAQESKDRRCGASARVPPRRANACVSHINGGGGMCTFSISAISCRCIDGGAISIPKMISRISDWVSDATLTLFFLP